MELNCFAQSFARTCIAVALVFVVLVPLAGARSEKASHDPAPPLRDDTKPALTPLCPSWMPWQTVLAACEEAAVSPEQLLFLRNAHRAYRARWAEPADAAGSLMHPDAVLVYQAPWRRVDARFARQVMRDRARAIRLMKEIDLEFMASIERVFHEAQATWILPWMRVLRQADFVLGHPIASQIRVLHAHAIVLSTLKDRTDRLAAPEELLDAARSLGRHMNRVASECDSALEDWYKRSFESEQWRVIERSLATRMMQPGFRDARTSWRELLAPTAESCDAFVQSAAKSLRSHLTGLASTADWEQYVCCLHMLYWQVDAPGSVRFFRSFMQSDLQPTVQAQLDEVHKTALRTMASTLRDALGEESTLPSINCPRDTVDLTWRRPDATRRVGDQINTISTAAINEFRDIVGAETYNTSRKQLPAVIQRIALPRRLSTTRTEEEWRAWRPAAQPSQLLRAGVNGRALDWCRPKLDEILGDNDAGRILDGWRNDLDDLARKARDQLGAIQFVDQLRGRITADGEQVREAQRVAATLHDELAALDAAYLNRIRESRQQPVADIVSLSLIELDRAYVVWGVIDVHHRPYHWPWCVHSAECEINLSRLVDEIEDARDRDAARAAVAARLSDVKDVLQTIRTADEDWLFTGYMNEAVRLQAQPAADADIIEFRENQSRWAWRLEPSADRAIRARAALASLHREVIESCCETMENPASLRRAWRRQAFRETARLQRDFQQRLESAHMAAEGDAALQRRVRAMEDDIDLVIRVRVAAEDLLFSETDNDLRRRSMIDYANLLAEDLDAELTAINGRYDDVTEPQSASNALHIRDCLCTFGRSGVAQRPRP